MKSTVIITRETTALIIVEHPDDWDDAQVKEATQNRALDVVNAIQFWKGSNRTGIAEIALGEELTMEAPNDGSCYPMSDSMPEIGLTADDLSGEG